MTRTNRKRYSTSEVADALHDTANNTFTPHSQIVLAAEVCALRESIRIIARAVLQADNADNGG